MTASDAARPAAVPPREPDEPVERLVRPMPRLGRGIVWSDVVAEIEHDRRQGLADAA